MTTKDKVFVGALVLGSIVLAHLGTARHWTMATSALVSVLFVLAVLAIARQRITRLEWLVLGAWVIVNVLITVGQR